jgi:mannosyl-3-phosphoglycerate phosphatase
MSSRSLAESQSWVIFTDLDGTLLDHHSYSFAETEPALRLLRDRNIPWLFNTSKTFAELKQLRIEIGNNWPMLIENGSGVAVPENSACQSD